MKVIGLTGGTGSGKSVVSRFLKEMGAVIVDADLVSRQIVEVGKPAYEEIVAYFGKDILQEDGTIFRKKLGEIVFHDEEKLDVYKRQMQDIRYDQGCSNSGYDDGQRSCANHCNLRQVQPETKQNNCILQNLFGCVLNPFLKDTLLTEDLCEDHPKNDGKNGSTNHRKLMP